MNYCTYIHITWLLWKKQPAVFLHSKHLFVYLVFFLRAIVQLDYPYNLEPELWIYGPIQVNRKLVSDF